jgi:anti-sigma regulatory factor (Ser/Thr protein kinase)
MDVTDRPRRLALKCDPNERGTRRERLAIAEHCAGRLAPDTVSDMQLVASELVTNAFEHGARGVVTLDVTLDGESATVTVTSTGNSSGIRHPSTWSFPETTTSSGRGLALARTMSHSIELHTAIASFAPDWVSITAHLGPRHGPPVAAAAPAA